MDALIPIIAALSLDPVTTVAARETNRSTARVSQYEFRAILNERSEPLTFTRDSVLNWSNPVFGTTDGGLFLWTLWGRPVAAMKTYKTNNGRWFEQMRSFSTTPLNARETPDTDPFWTPPSGLDMQPLPESDTPAASESARALQMRAIHRSFTVTGQLASGPQVLRVLPQPLLRYKSEGIVDGVLLAFVQGTGADMLLLLEAREEEGELSWYYSLGSVGIFEVQVERNGEIIWTEPRRPFQNTDPEETYFARRLPPDIQ